LSASFHHINECGQEQSDIMNSWILLPNFPWETMSLVISWYVIVISWYVRFINPKILKNKKQLWTKLQQKWCFIYKHTGLE